MKHTSTWRVPWALAQITGVLFSTLVWILLVSASPPAALVALVVGVALVAGRNTAAGLWWRFGASPATPRDAELVLAALVPIVGLRGRNQPQVWIGRHACGGAVITGRHLVINERLLDRRDVGDDPDEAICAAARQALALREITSSAVVALVAVYSLPWLMVEETWRRGAAAVARTPLLSLAWRSRWLVFAIAIVHSWQAGRWAALIVVTMLAALSWSTGSFRVRLVRILARLGDQAVGQDRRSQRLAADRRLAGMGAAHGRRDE